MTDLSIIIVSYNTKDITKKCLETVQTSLKTDLSIKAEIIVVDNNSTDGTVNLIGKLADKVIENKDNIGFSKANNQAAKKAEGEYLLFLNSDTETINDAIPNLYKFFKSQSEFQFVGAKLLNRDGSPQASAGPMFSLPVIFAFLFLKGDYYGLTRYSPDKVKSVDWVSGACIMTKKEYFEKIDGFDENIFMYMEEIDLLYRALLEGMKTGFFPQAKFTHLGMASSNGRTEPIIQVYRGYMYFYKKHKSLWQISLLRIMLKLKADIALLIGILTKNNYLLKTYGEAKKFI